MTDYQRRTVGFLVLCVCAMTAGSVLGKDRLATEREMLQQWVDVAFVLPAIEPLASPKPEDRLEIVAKSHKVLLNRTVWDTPLRLGKTAHEHGVFMDAPATVRVRLSRPAKEFTAVAGIDVNDNTQSAPQVPSVRFHVSVKGRRVFSSPVRRLADGPLPVRVALDGATEFLLEVDDSGDGRVCDQADWADAAVTYADGKRRFLDAFPMAERHVSATGQPFSFRYGGKPSARLLPGWRRTEETTEGKDKTETTIRYQCPKTGLLVEVHRTSFHDVAAVDWVCYLENRGKADTPILDNFLPLDADLLKVAGKATVTLRSSEGDHNHPTAFMPHDEPLDVGTFRHFAAHGGRSSNAVGGGVAPFFNLLAPGGGWILAVGWTGQWKAEFERSEDGRVAVLAGMERTHFRLKPGERVRTPRVVLLRYQGDEMIDGHNRFRRLMLTHYCRQENGRPIIPPICHNTAATVYRSKHRATEANQLAIIAKAAKLGIEAYWLDAYWYPQPWHEHVGTWVPRPEDFPRGLKPLGDAAHAAGMKFVLWFEPERVRPNTQFDREHPDFLVKLDGQVNRLFNLADPKARDFLTDFLDSRIRQWGVDVYRNDFNFEPLPYWQNSDANDRQGISEMRYVEGLYTMWAELIRRNPGLTIDNCASGGRRIDLEMCRLSWPLWRSDYNDIGQGLKGEAYWPRMGLADQIHSAGLALYVPLHAGPLWDMSPYSVRSCMSGTVILYERILHEKFPDELAKQGIAEVKQLRKFYLGDYYPLMPLTASQEDWWAYQLDRPDLAAGIVLAFRRPDSTRVSATVRLRGIDPDAQYEVSITGETYEQTPFVRMSGKTLCELKLDIPAQPGSVLLQYRRAK